MKFCALRDEWHWGTEEFKLADLGYRDSFVLEGWLASNTIGDIMDTYIQKRANALYSEDERQVIRQSHNNPQIKQLYDEFLGKPNSHKAHELLHTHYNARIGFND